MRSTLSLFIVGPLAALAPIATGCANTPASEEAQSGSAAVSESGLSAEATAKWNAYVEKANQGVTLQTGCTPKRLSRPSGVAYKGVAILTHGFAQCPRQMEDLAGPLANAGFEVLLTLLPGHGRVPTTNQNGELQDDLSVMPAPIANPYQSEYAQLAKTMTEIARASDGTRLAVGFSAGGMVTTTALLEGEGAWDRAVLLAPFFSPSEENWNGLGAQALTWIGIGGGYTNTWKDCVERRNQNLNSISAYCSIQARHLEAIRQLGELVAKRAWEINIPTQVVGTENDTAASSPWISEFAAKLTGGYVCFYPKGVPHTFVASFDKPGMAMPWLPLLYRQVAEFGAADTPAAFPTQNLYSSMAGSKLCQIQAQ